MIDKTMYALMQGKQIIEISSLGNIANEWAKRHYQHGEENLCVKEVKVIEAGTLSKETLDKCIQDMTWEEDLMPNPSYHIRNLLQITYLAVGILEIKTAKYISREKKGELTV